MSRVLRVSFLLWTLLIAIFFSAATTQAQSTQIDQIQILITPQPCSSSGRCPVDLETAYGQRGESCAASLAEFQANPTQTHYWIEDPKITAQGRANERARQFIYWTLNTQSLDSSPIITNAWRISSNISFFLVAVVATIMGIGLIMGQRLRFQSNVQVWPLIFKLAGILFYIALSAAFLLFLIQISEILMKFFLEAVGGKDFFNIYFSSNPNEFINVQSGGTAPTGASATGNSEFNYLNFQGCRDLNIRVQEGAQAEIFLFNVTNITYYTMGVMVLLRKILLWFLVFVAPFAAILIPFAFVRNVAWIWLGVFLQWLFYGPLFALFLSATSIIWKQGIPFLFNFTRVDKLEGYVYPTAINITYGGPAQRLSALNNGNYVDTFAEYVITLIMLWACIMFPWWLLRIFRDYCCDYLMAMKNILLNMYDEMRSPQGPSPQGPLPSPTGPSTSTTKVFNNSTQSVNQPTTLTTIEEIRRADTKQIINDVKMSATKLTDIAQFETNKSTQQTVQNNLQKLQNPMTAETPAERQKYMNIRTELFNRALKNDEVAKQTLATITNSVTEKQQQRTYLSNQIFNSFQAPRQQSQSRPVSEVISSRVQMPAHTIEKMQSTLGAQVTQTNTIVQKIAEKTQMATPAVQQIFQTWNHNISQSPTTIVQQTTNNQTVTNAMASDKTVINQLSAQTNIPANVVQKVISSVANTQTTNTGSQIQNIAQVTNVQSNQVQDIVNRYETAVANTSQSQQSQLVKEIATVSRVSESTVEHIIQKVSESGVVDRTTQIQNIAQVTNVQSNQVQDIVNRYETAVSQVKQGDRTHIIQNVANATSSAVETVQNVVNSLSQVQNMSRTEQVQHIAQSTQVNAQKVSEIVNHYETALAQNTQVQQQQTVEQIAQATHVPAATISQIINRYTTQTNTRSAQVQNIAKATNTDVKTVENIMNQYQNVAANISQSEQHKIVQNIAQTARLPESAVNNVIQTWKNQKETTEHARITQIAQEAGVSESQAQNIVNKYQVIKKDKIRTVIRQIHEEAKKDKAVVREIAQKHGVEEQKVEQMLQAEAETVADQGAQPVEKQINIPASISLEDYEEVRKMWQKQYQAGEVPAGENFATRDEWIHRDIVFITNTLNKLISSDVEMRNQGLDDVAYILPIFMVNNFKGEELLVYLKAKLEAAKSVEEQLEREEEIKQKLQAKSDDVFVDVEQKKEKDKEQTLTMALEQEIDPQEKALQDPVWGDTTPEQSAVSDQQVQDPRDAQAANTEPVSTQEAPVQNEPTAPTGSLAELLSKSPPVVTNTSNRVEELKAASTDAKKQ